MSELIEKGIVLTYDEIRILLHSMNVKAIDGVYMPEKEFSKEDIIRSLHHMSNAGFVEVKEQKFHIREDIKEILTTMAFPSNTQVLNGEENEQSYFIYRKDSSYVVSEKEWKRNDALKLRLFDEDSYLRWREDKNNDHC